MTLERFQVQGNTHQTVRKNHAALLGGRGWTVFEEDLLNITSFYPHPLDLFNTKIKAKLE